MEGYARAKVEKQPEKLGETEVRVLSNNHMRSYISHAMGLLNEKGHDEVVLKAMGRAINKTVAIAEVLKRRVAGLHQVTEVGSTDITDVWEPTKEGLEKLEIVRHVSIMSITLSKKPLDATLPGYQPPLPESELSPSPIDDAAPDPLVTELETRSGERSGGRGGGGGGGGGAGARGPREPKAEGAKEGEGVEGEPRAEGRCVRVMPSLD
ncbi:hypothetical protein FOA52_008271 [Chlamydomonas sp. UWO 241]|nr:hypothetical protein FOA52_008271 [Chlamydomonas sp. UWO 241]